MGRNRGLNWAIWVWSDLIWTLVRFGILTYFNHSAIILESANVDTLTSNVSNGGHYWGIWPKCARFRSAGQSKFDSLYSLTNFGTLKILIKMVRIYKLRALSLSDAIKIKKLEIKAKCGILLWIRYTNACAWQ